MTDKEKIAELVELNLTLIEMLKCLAGEKDIVESFPAIYVSNLHTYYSIRDYISKAAEKRVTLTTLYKKILGHLSRYDLDVHIKNLERWGLILVKQTPDATMVRIKCDIKPSVIKGY